MDSGLEASAQSYSFYLCSLQKKEKKVTSDECNYQDYPRRLFGTCVSFWHGGVQKCSYYEVRLVVLEVKERFLYLINARTSSQELVIEGCLRSTN
ncbi:hypothetical protein NC652_039710 [Populus alba x Populus x berolinensis]|nr:hypothetical protein NC652_039710 [Populus alba x Populus x berolinensis]